MTPYISHRSIFIIFLISINIVSVVCILYEPIKENPVVVENQRKFTYFNYLRAPSQYPEGLPKPNRGLKKLDVDQYYNSYYNDKYWTMPDIKQDLCYKSWKETHSSYCDNEYVSHSHFVTTYHVAEFGNYINNLRECLKDNYSFEVLQLCCDPNHTTTEEAAGCLEILNEDNRKFATACFDEFKAGVVDLFGKKNEHSEYIKDLTFEAETVERRAVIAFGIATAQKDPNGFDDETFQDLLKNYEAFTDDTTYTDDTTKFKNECSKRFEKYGSAIHDKWLSTYVVLRGFNNYKEFSRQIEISLKYLEGLEGKLVNNKKLFDEFHKNKITKEDYKELFIPLPLKHEDFYPLYFMRIKFLGYIPVDKRTWKKQMDELKETITPNNSWFAAKKPKEHTQEENSSPVAGTSMKDTLTKALSGKSWWG